MLASVYEFFVGTSYVSDSEAIVKSLELAKGSRFGE